MKKNIVRLLSAVTLVLLVFSFSAFPVFAQDVVDDSSLSVEVSFTLDEFISSLNAQGFEVEIVEQSQNQTRSAATTRSTVMKITRALPSYMVSPTGGPIAGQAYLFAEYEENTLSGITYRHFTAHQGHGIELFDSSYTYNAHYSEYQFVNGNTGVKWNGSGQFEYETSHAVSAGFGWVGASVGSSTIYRSPAHSWAFSFQFPQAV